MHANNILIIFSTSIFRRTRSALDGQPADCSVMHALHVSARLSHGNWLEEVQKYL
jgi:hypothetical protein